MSRPQDLLHSRISRRTAVQAGAIGLLGLGSNHLRGLQAADSRTTSAGTAKCCIYIFLSGGLSQHESFDPKPNAPAEVRGEFSAIPTQTLGLDICEHLPGLAQRSQLWSVVRSLTHPTNEHTLGLLDTTLIVMGSEFGRTPKLSTLSESFPDAGRDHWGAVQSVFFAGGGIQGGRVVGSSDELGAYPASSPYRPENMAATMYGALGIPATATWHDEFQRPHQIYHGEPIQELL